MACARSAARGKRRKPDAAAFLLNMEPECFRLAAELAAGTWTPGAYRSYVIREPKPRLISAAPALCPEGRHRQVLPEHRPRPPEGAGAAGDRGRAAAGRA
jgi:hypothetical protein